MNEHAHIRSSCSTWTNEMIDKKQISSAVQSNPQIGRLNSHHRYILKYKQKTCKAEFKYNNIQQLAEYNMIMIINVKYIAKG